MKISFLKKGLIEQLPPWAYTYKDMYIQELTKRGVSCIQEEDKITSNILFLCHKKELELYKNSPLYREGIKTILQSNGSSASVYNANIDKQEEEEDLKFVTYNITARDIHTKALKDFFNIKNVYTVGFPVYTPSKIKYKPIKGKFLIGGRLVPEKCVFKAIELCYANNAKEIHVCYPPGEERWVKYYPKSSHIFYKCLSQEDFLKEMETSEFLVNASLGDTSSIVDVQARRIGLKIINDTNVFETSFPYYYSNGDYMKMYEIETCATNLLKILK